MFRVVTILGVCLLGLAGCRKAPEAKFSNSAELQALRDELRTPIENALAEKCQTPAHPLVPWDADFDSRKLGRGFLIYQKRCTQCHGVSGDGNGPVAGFMYPRPRDYRKGMFKFGSTPFGSKPVRADLVRTVQQGVPGTSMPSFHLLPDPDIEAVVDYILALSYRGELELQLTNEVSIADAYEPDVLKDSISLVQDRWAQADSAVYQPLSTQPVFTAESVVAGKAAFLSKGCAQCHGTDGRGQTPENLKGDRKDVWGYATRAADLTSGMLHGGSRPIDIYRRIYGGINGTPMPAFNNVLKDEPETIWNLVAFVLHVSGRRRAGEVPESGNIAPYVISAGPAAP